MKVETLALIVSTASLVLQAIEFYRNRKPRKRKKKRR